MPPTMIAQRMFNIGEVDVDVYKRTDSDAYLNSAQKLLNMEVGTTGLCKKRKGTRFLKDVSAQFDPNSQLYEYVDKNQNHYIIMSADTAIGWFAFLVDPITGALGSAITVGGTPPYLSAELPAIDYALDNDSLVLAHPSYPPARIYISTYPNTFTYQVLQITPYYPVYDFNVINYNTFTAVFTNPTPATFRLVLNGVGAGAFTTDWINGQILAVGDNPTQPLGYGIITAVTPGVNTVQFDGNVVVKFAPIASMPTIGSQYSIRQPAWSATLGYPAVTTFYQNRLWFANTPLLAGTVFGSKINQPTSFDVGTGADTDAIIYNIGQTNSGQILWMNGGKQLEIYSENFEFAAPQEQNAALTPATFSIRQQSAYGSSSLCKPTTYINDSYYISRNGNAIINFHFNGIGLTYQSSNVSLVSQHLVINPINRALLRADDISQDNFIYFLNSDFSVTAFQFAAEFKLAALTPVDFNTDERNPIFVFDVCSVNNKIYFLKEYILTGIIALEVFDNDIRVDSYITANMDSAGVVTTATIPLSNLEGYFVETTFEGVDGDLNDLGVHQIVGGTFVADNPNEYSGTVKIGLLYNVLVKPMYITPGNSKIKTATGATYDFKNLNRIYVDYVDSLDFRINGTLVEYQSFAEIQLGAGLVPQTDTAIVAIASGWARFSTFEITQSSPFDLKITGISYQIESHII